VHAVIKQYRDARKIMLNIEQRLMIKMAPDYQHLTLIQKVETYVTTSKHREHVAMLLFALFCVGEPI
jgi:phosphatidylinositol kinase/protein kinase (PI-3  family)